MTTSSRRAVTVTPSSHEANAYASGGGFHQSYDDETQDDLVLPADCMSLAPENLAERVQTTQLRLSELRVEAEALEREKLQFEELSRKQKEFMQGRVEMAEKLGRSIAMLDRETYEAQKRVEQLLVIKDNFHQHLDVVESLNPEQWNPQELHHDLTRALGIIEDAREEYVKAIARVQMLTSSSAAPMPAVQAVSSVSHVRETASNRVIGVPIEISRSAFRTWAFCGAAFTMPLGVVAVLYILVRLITG